jgi:hypothetical protein
MMNSADYICRAILQCTISSTRKTLKIVLSVLLLADSCLLMMLKYIIDEKY